MSLAVAVHGGLGAIALVAGLVAALAPKRAGVHVVAGRVFAVIMMLSLVAIAGPVFARTNVFMMGLGSVAGFAVIEGWRALRRMRGALQEGPDAADYVLVGVTGLCGVGLAAFGIYGLARTGNPLFGVCLAFAGLDAVLLRASVARWSRQLTKKQWLAVHIGHMSGALGAAITAAMVVNLEGIFGSFQWVLWVAPTVISTVWGQRAIRERGLV